MYLCTCMSVDDYMYQRIFYCVTIETHDFLRVTVFFCVFVVKLVITKIYLVRHDDSKIQVN